MNTLKCSQCNIVIDELLAYVQNKISVIDEETLKRICVSAFTSSEISKSKCLLFESLPPVQRKILRKGSKKEERDLDDIISVFKSVDPDIIPVFVARVLEKLPPILFDHLDCTKLLKDLTKLSSEIADIKATYITVQQFEELRSDIRNLKYASLPPSSVNLSTGYVNIKRGAWNMSSGPVGLTLDHNSSAEEHENLQGLQLQNNECNVLDVNKDNCALECTPQSQSMHENETSTPPVTTEAESAIDAVAPPIQLVSYERGGMPSTEMSPISVNPGDTIQKIVTINSQPQTANESKNAWRTVNRRQKKPKYRYLGEKGKAETSTSSFKAAEKMTPIFITNVHNDTVESDIVDYIKSKTQVTVSLEKINTKKILNHKAYKFFVPETKVTEFLDENIWPDGIIFRRFVHYKNRRADGVALANGPQTSKYG